jgi:uncharacterized repeat protein (TIGR03803 family)
MLRPNTFQAGNEKRMCMMLRSVKLALALTSVPAFIAFCSTSQAATYTQFYSFAGGAHGQDPRGRLLVGSQATIFGITQDGGSTNSGAVYSLSKEGEFSLLYSFLGRPDGDEPFTGVIQDPSGNLYGTTIMGGSQNDGTVFGLAANDGSEHLMSFGPDVAQPTSGLIRDEAGNLYGMTEFGGTANKGTVFTIAPSGKRTVLHSFTGQSDGSNPQYGYLARDSQGNLYGATGSGGVNSYGVIFKLAPSGTETILYSFTLDACINPNNSIAVDAAGNIFGSTFDGYGPGIAGHGCIFELTASGQYQVLHTFRGNGTGTQDGAYPETGVTIDSSDNVYGVTAQGGLYGYGVVYEVKPDGTYIPLHQFAGGADGDGQYSSEVTITKDAAIIGPTSGGEYGYGALYKIVR